ncbi:hypothetical protein ABEB36_001925 [Hypothenemus hampei]|uniref:Uncharacterized protein n=1 Tax=Hypothenemus hampei TaxID=57062 RepID=A0ABD1FG99_HYPHA
MNFNHFFANFHLCLPLSLSRARYNMSPIENVVPMDGDVIGHDDVMKKLSDRSRDLFGLQLEVTGLLLEAERRKLAVLQKELQIALAEGGSIKAKEHQKQELLSAIGRIQAQHDHLDKEYRQHALGALISANSRGSGKVRIRTLFTRWSHKLIIYNV